MSRPLAGSGRTPGCGTVAGAMRRLRTHATRAAVAVAVFVALGSTASISGQARAATGHGDDRRAVHALAFAIGAAALRPERPGLHPVVGRGGPGGWRAPAAVGVVAALLAAVPWRRGRRTRPAARGRGQLPLPGQGSRAPPAVQPG
jgi:hypothetical protein